MSTVVVTKRDKDIAIGADTLCKLNFTNESAEYIENPSKILRVGDSLLAYVGHASFGLILNSYFGSLGAPPKFDSESSIFEMARNLHLSLREDFFLNTTETEDDPFESSQFDCLIANKTGIYGLYSLRSVQKYRKFYSFGTGYKFALGAMRTAYELNLSAVDVAKSGLEAATDFDEDSGAPLEIHTI